MSAAVEDLTSPSDRFACAPFHAIITVRVCLARRGGGRTLRPPTPAFPSLAAIPWAGASGIIDASAYAAFLRHERTMADADEWGMLDDRGRFIDFDGAEFGDWIDPLPRAPRAPQPQRSPKTEMTSERRDGLRADRERSVSARTQSPAVLQRRIDALQAKLRAQETAWTRGGVEAWRAKVATKTCRAQIAQSARKWGRMLGPTFEELLAARLVCVDAQNDGVELTQEAALELVERWSSEGPRQRAAARRVA